MNYTNLRKEECQGGMGWIGIEINVATKNPANLQLDSVRMAAQKASDLIQDAVMTAQIAQEPEHIEHAKAQRQSLTDLFCIPHGLIYVEEIPNEYCSRYCCKHLPWFIITTVIGRFKIGWRKHVLNLDWSEVPNGPDGYKLFEDQQTTKGEKYIHAWSLEKAQFYINQIFASVAK